MRRRFHPFFYMAPDSSRIRNAQTSPLSLLTRLVASEEWELRSAEEPAPAHRDKWVVARTASDAVRFQKRARCDSGSAVFFAPHFQHVPQAFSHCFRRAKHASKMKHHKGAHQRLGDKFPEDTIRNAVGVRHCPPLLPIKILGAQTLAFLLNSLQGPRTRCTMPAFYDALAHDRFTSQLSPMLNQAAILQR